MTLTASAPNRSVARAAALLVAACAPVVVTSTHLGNICWSPTHGSCGPTTCRVGNSYSCGDTGECTCYDMNTGCGSNTSLPGGLLGKEYCGFRAEPGGDECGWCAATGECSTRATCPATPPTPAPTAPTPQPTPAPRQWKCADLRPACNTCGACCNSRFDAASCMSCVTDVCKPEAPPVPCELSPFNVTPAPGVLGGPCKCTVVKARFPDDEPLVYTFSALNYTDGAGCDMRLPVGGAAYAEPIFATEYQRDVLQLNGRNFSGINRVIGGIPAQYNYSVTDTNMYWRPDDRIVGSGWELTFSVPDPSSAHVVV